MGHLWDTCGTLCGTLMDTSCVLRPLSTFVFLRRGDEKHLRLQCLLIQLFTPDEGIGPVEARFVVARPSLTPTNLPIPEKSSRLAASGTASLRRRHCKNFTEAMTVQRFQWEKVPTEFHSMDLNGSHDFLKGSNSEFATHTLTRLWQLSAAPVTQLPLY